MSIIKDIFFFWYKERSNISEDSSEKAFEEYINSLSNIELLKEISSSAENLYITK